MLCNMLFSMLCNMLYGLAIQHCYIVMLYIQLLCYIGCYITNVIQLVIQSAMQPVSKNIQYDIQLIYIKYMLYNMYICHIYLLYSMVYNRLYNTKFLVLAGVGASRAFKDRETCQDAPGIWPGHNCSIIIQASHCKRNDMSVHMIYNILYYMVYTTYATYHAISHTINHLHMDVN